MKSEGVGGERLEERMEGRCVVGVSGRSGWTEEEEG